LLLVPQRKPKLTGQTLEDLALQGLLVLKQLLNKAAPYFSHQEEGVLSTLIRVRGKYPAKTNITSAIEEISEKFVLLADPTAGIESLLKITLPGQMDLKTPGWCMAISILAELVRTSRPSFLETQLDRLGKMAVKVYSTRPFLAVLG
jgi:CLIP-associating protein 1/2